MKTSTLRAAICIALFTAGSAASPAKALGAQVEQETEPQVHSEDALPPVEAGDAEVTELASMTVTGTRIRGGATPSPVIDITRERIREEGFTDLGEVIRSVPQNFRGGQNPGVLPGNLAGAGLSNNNLTGGSGLNLRGLGPDASLTLLNGRRMSYGGFVQAVDISSIPTQAVERIEIVADGASAIYGSDAVGGVGNVIIRRDLDGVEVSARVGGATDGGMSTREYNVAAGTTWATGGAILTYRDASVDPIYARQRDYTSYLADPTTIFPGSSSRSGLFSASHEIGGLVDIGLEALLSDRDQNYNYYLNNRITFVTANTATSLISPSFAFYLPNDWLLTLAGTWGEDKHKQQQARLTLATGEITPQLDMCYCNDSRAYEIAAEGPLVRLPSGDARLALGAGYRRIGFWNTDYAANTTDIQGSETSRFVYAEASAPLIAGRQGSARPVLELTTAFRSEDYGSHGRVTTPKAGVVVSPSEDFTVKASWGKSFKMPTLFMRYQAQGINLTHPSVYGGEGYPEDAQMLTIGGGSPDLKPERARTWSASMVFHPANLPQLKAEVSWFDIDYTDRVMQPITNHAAALNEPNYARFITLNPTVAQQEAVIAAVDNIYNFVGVPHDASKVVALMDARYVNISQQRIRGLDLSGSYRFDLGGGWLTTRGAISYLNSRQATSTTEDSYKLTGTLHNPPRITGRLGAVWDRGGWSASAFAHYLGGVTDTLSGHEGGSFTTLDTSLRYQVGAGAGVWSGLEFSLSAQNVLNRKPPLYTPPPVAADYRVPYDSTNYSAIGRYVALGVSKQW